MRFAAGAVMALVCSAAFATETVQRTLTFDDRVKAQNAIERVYYSHQLGTTKPFSEAVPRAVLESKVRKYLEQSAALNTYWKTAVTDYTLQRELERMAQGTKMPERLLELYAALGNDSFLIKECLARPALVDRLTHNFYAFDPAQHVRERGQADALHQLLVSGALSPSAEHPNRTVTELVVSETEAGPARPEQASQQRLTAAEFQKKRAELPTSSGQVSDVKETRDSFVFSVILTETATSARVANYVVPKTTWDAWWDKTRGTVRSDSVMAVASGRVDLPAPRHAAPFDPLTACPGEGWDNGILDALPQGRAWHTAVWTGNVMVIWGGSIGYPFEGLNSGSRYDPATDTFTPTSTVNAPRPRLLHTAVWAGSQMIVWGGIDNLQLNHYLRSGGRYNPVTNTWLAVSSGGAPSGRAYHTAVWTGTSMVIWGGQIASSPYEANTGGRYDPNSDTWTSTSTTGAPSARDSHTAVWTGTDMVVWGGYGGLYVRLNTGARYNPTDDTWLPTTTTGAPSGRLYHTAIWSGHVMVIWGGADSIVTGGRYDPSTDSWEATSVVNAPRGGDGSHTAVWTGNVMVVWGMYDPDGHHNSGGRYDPSTDTWTATSLVGAPSPRELHTAIWTGTHMIVWGGGPNTGGRYDPTTDNWTPTYTAGFPDYRVDQSAVWTGTAMVIWGGDTFVSDTPGAGTGGRYDPTIDTWSLTNTTGAPINRRFHTAVWTGNKMVVWGGRTYNPGFTLLNTGGSYDPVADSWSATSTVDAPIPREVHTVVWSGDAMLVWGGRSSLVSPQELNTGGQYDPQTDTWTDTAVLGAPTPRVGHTATWTGSEMVIWGGEGVYPMEYLLKSGGRYDPTLGTWTATSVDGAPEARNGHTAVWADGEVLIWGGVGGGQPAELNSGGRYNPSTDAWTPTSRALAPSPRQFHSAVWTGTEMIVWGGGYYGNTGGRYSPATNTWRATTTVSAPSGGGPYSTVWTGNMMVAWSGARNNGGRYIPGTIRDNDDCDGDGYSLSAGDCDDLNASVYPGAPQICDGVNNDCFAYGWPAIPYDEADIDRDGVGTCNGDCNDNDPSVYPDAEQLCDGLNNDCNDHSWPMPPANEADFDGDRYRICQGDCDDRNPYVSPGWSESCDGIDNNCDGIIDNGGDALCNDNNPCTDDACGGAAHCIRSFNTNSCSDNNGCTLGDTCSGGYCHSGPPRVCDDGNPCTDDSCNPATGGCFSQDNDNNHCGDDDLCTRVDACQAGICRGSNPVDCNADCPAEFTAVDGLCQFSYDIDASHLDNLPTYCDESGTSLFNDCNGQNYGFHWTDQAVDLAGVTNVELQFEAGLNCGGSFSGLILNGVSVGGFDPDENCDCESIQGTISIPHLDVSAYVPGGFNVISITPGSACEGLSTSDDLGGAFARITVTYAQGHLCQLGTCDPGTGACGFSPSPDGADCTDNNACTTGDSCIDGACNGAALDCNDNNLCTDDSCDPEFGCVTVRAPAGRSCDDHNACDGTEACDAYGICVSSNPPQCDDHVVCTEDSCDPVLGCGYRPYPAGTSCADGNACNGVEQCDGGGHCTPGIALDCDDLSLCSRDYCDPSLGCQHVPYPAGTSCSDGDACNGIEVCTGAALCPKALPPNCNDNNPCTDDSCDPSTGCVHTNNTNPCSDGNACTTFDSCGGGSCHGGAPLACGDGNPCTDDFCDATTGCVHTNSSKLCDDGDACTTDDRCGGGTCNRGAPIKCGDGNACTTDSCDPATGCVFTNNADACDDGNACTIDDHCAGGTCGAGSPVTCSALDQCHTSGTCNPATGACSNPPKPNGSMCDDASLCSIGETCQSGTCTPAFSGLSEPNPRTNGYYKRLCQGPHSGDRFGDSDATCVASVAATFAGISTVADLCAVLQPNHPNSDPCGKTEVDLVVLALNICRARVCTAQSIDSQCGGNGSVGQSLAESDDILRSETRDGTSCAHAKCLDEEINTGRALEMNTLTLRREGSGVRLDWQPPYLDDGTGHPGKYNVWRRTQGSLAAFTKIGTTTDATFVDSLAASGTFEYEVTAVMN